MKILLVEDDLFHAKVIRAALKTAFPDAEFDECRTEKQFMVSYKATAQYSALVFDQMLPWTSEDDENLDTPKPPSEGPLRAGNRCYAHLTEPDKRRTIFFTNLEKGTVPEGVAYVRKKDDPELRALIQAIKERVAQGAE